MRRLAEDNEGEFAIYMGNRYLVIRERFEQYIVNLSHGRGGRRRMKNPSPGVKNIITPTEAIDYFVLNRRKFYDLLKSDEQKNFLVL